MITKHRYGDGNDTKAWEALRNSMSMQIGGSEIGTLAGHNPYCSAFTMFCQRCGAVKTPILKKKEAIIQGHDGEEGVAKRFCREMGKEVHRENCIYTNDKYRCLKASIDRKVTGENSGLECKTAKDMAMAKYKHGDFPMSYFDQCLLYLAVTELDRWYLAIQVFGTNFRMFMMTTIQSEAETYNRLKDKFFEWENYKSRHYAEWTWNMQEKRFVYEGEGDAELEMPGNIDVDDPDLVEWETKWCKLESVYYVDADEFVACEELAEKFVSRLQIVKDAMDEFDKTHDETDVNFVNERKTYLVAAARQVWPMDEVDGSESTWDTVSILTPDVVVDSVLTVDEESSILKAVQQRDEIAKQIKELESAMDALDSQVALAIGTSETVKMPGWKVTYKMGASREYANVTKVKEYFSNKGLAVPEGIITSSEGKRSLRFWTQSDKAKKGKKAAQ